MYLKRKIPTKNVPIIGEKKKDTRKRQGGQRGPGVELLFVVAIQETELVLGRLRLQDP